MRRGLASAVCVLYCCWYCSTTCLAVPWVGVVSVVRDAGVEDLFRSHNSLLHQTIPVQWTIVDCGTEDSSTAAALVEIQMDSSVRVVRLQKKTIMQCLDHVLRQELPSYVSVLAVGDEYTPPALESMAWLLFSNSDSIVASCYMESLSQQFDLPLCSVQPPCPCVPLGSLVPVAVLRRLCLPDDRMTDVHHWWSACAAVLLQQVGTGYTVPRKMLLTRRFDNYSAPTSSLRPPREVFPIVDIPWELPPVEPRAQTGKVILVALPWLYVGGSEFVVRNTIQRLFEEGWTVVVVCTIHDSPLAHAFVPQIQPFTQDIHWLSWSLPVRDHARFFLHLIRSRRVDVVLGSNCFLYYHIVAHLQTQAPGVAFVDMLHSVAVGWINGGYPRVSIDHHEWLDYSLAISKGTLDWMRERQPAIESRSAVMYPGVVIPAVVPPFASRPSVVSVARMDGLKRPQVVIRAFLGAVAGFAHNPPSLQMVGEGASFGQSVDICKRAGAVATTPTDPGKVYFHGSLSSSHVKSVLGESRLFVLASVLEGMPLAASEAMAHGLALIISDVGQVKELVGDAAFRVISITEDDEQDTALFADAIRAFLTLSEEEQRAWGDKGRVRMQSMYDRSKTIGMIVPLFNSVVEEKRKFASTPGHVREQGDLAGVLTAYVELNPSSLLNATLAEQRRESGCHSYVSTRVVSLLGVLASERVVQTASIVAILVLMWSFRKRCTFFTRPAPVVLNTPRVAGDVL